MYIKKVYLMSPNITLQLRDCLDNNTDIPGDILGAVVKNRISKKDCVDNVSEKLENTVRQLAVFNLRQNYNRGPRRRDQKSATS